VRRRGANGGGPLAVFFRFFLVHCFPSWFIWSASTIVIFVSALIGLRFFNCAVGYYFEKACAFVCCLFSLVATFYFFSFFFRLRYSLHVGLGYLSVAIHYPILSCVPRFWEDCYVRWSLSADFSWRFCVPSFFTYLAADGLVRTMSFFRPRSPDVLVVKCKDYFLGMRAILRFSSVPGTCVFLSPGADFHRNFILVPISLFFEVNSSFSSVLVRSCFIVFFVGLVRKC